MKTICLKYFEKRQQIVMWKEFMIFRNVHFMRSDQLWCDWTNKDLRILQLCHMFILCVYYKVLVYNRTQWQNHNNVLHAHLQDKLFFMRLDFPGEPQANYFWTESILLLPIHRGKTQCGWYVLHLTDTTYLQSQGKNSFFTILWTRSWTSV